MQTWNNGALIPWAWVLPWELVGHLGRLTQALRSLKNRVAWCCQTQSLMLGWTGLQKIAWTHFIKISQFLAFKLFFKEMVSWLEKYFMHWIVFLSASLIYRVNNYNTFRRLGLDHSMLATSLKFEDWGWQKNLAVAERHLTSVQATNGGLSPLGFAVEGGDWSTVCILGLSVLTFGKLSSYRDH